MIKPTSLYTIGQISKLSNIPIKTLRFYDQEGLLQPEKRDEENNYRYYSENQLLQILIIKELKILGFSLDDIKSFIKKKDLLLLEQKLEGKLQEIKNNIEDLKMQLQTAVDNFEQIKNGKNILEVYKNIKNHNSNRVYNIEVKEIPKINVLFTRYPSICSATECFFDRYVELQAIRDKYQLYSSGSLMAIYHDHYTTQFFSNNKKLDLELCLPITGLKIEDCPYLKTFGGFTGVTTVHVGDYIEMFSAYLALVDWIEHNGFEIIGPAIEQYVIDPTNTENPADYVTGIIFPVRRNN
ncbi:MAG: MerR family transcriptional regulator [Dehalobacterium sp.]